jgi:pyrimidine-nucleoside phosphorylase
MHAVEIIAKKRDGLELSTEEINYFIEKYTVGDIPDYQAAAWLMAVFIQGMNRREIGDLTMAMANSGDVLDLSDVLPVSIDKHSSGGVGDKTSLVVLPIVAACGVPVAKMSGRGLGFSGGTLDKLESIKGFRVELTQEEFKQNAKKYGIVLAGQSGNFAPADGKLYALRDVTGTVPSLPLIASSIMSKKIAAGADAIVLDVKVGLGAFMTHIEDAEQLAHLMVDIGQGVGRRVVALLSDMNQPLGHAVGNALEVAEAVNCLRRKGPADLQEHCLVVAAHMLRLARDDHRPEALAQYVAEAADRLNTGAALEKLRVLVKAQGGDLSMIDDTSKLPQASIVEQIPAPHNGYILQINAQQVGLASVDLGAGREHKGDKIDYAVGLMVHVKVGDAVVRDEPLFTLYANDKERLQRAKERLANTIVLSSKPTAPLPAFYDTISSENFDDAAMSSR